MMMMYISEKFKNSTVCSAHKCVTIWRKEKKKKKDAELDPGGGNNCSCVPSSSFMSLITFYLGVVNKLLMQIYTQLLPKFLTWYV